MEKDKEVQQLVKRLARFLGLEAVEKRVFGFKGHVALEYQLQERTVIRIREGGRQANFLCQANFLSWKDALCKFLDAECFQVYQVEVTGVLSQVLQLDNPFFGMSSEEANLRLDLLAPEKKEEEEEKEER